MYEYNEDINKLISENKNQFNKIFKSSEKKFDEIIDQIYKYNNDIELIFSNPHLSKNIYLSNVYLNFCKIEFLKSLKISLNKKKKLITFIQYDNKKYILKKYIKLIKIISYSIILIICKFIFIKKNIKSKKITIVDTYITDDMFDGKKFTNKYFINTNLYKKNSKVFFLGTILLKKNIFKHIKTLRSNKYNYLFAFDILSVKEILSVIFYSQQFLKLKYPKKIQGYKIFFQNNINNDLYNGQIYISRILHLVIKKFKQKNIDIIKSVNWYENQPKDRSFNYSFKKYYENIQRISYKSILSDNDFAIHLIPSNREFKNYFYADIIKSNSFGDFIHKKKKKLFMPIDKGPLGRFEYLVNKAKSTKNISNSILVVLPLETINSMNIINLIINFLKINNNYLFYIKIHPETPHFKNLKKLAKIYKNIFLIKGNISEIFNNFSTLITNGSSVAVESLFKNKNIIISHYKENRINNPLKYYKYNKLFLVSNEHELQKTINNLNKKKSSKTNIKAANIFCKKCLSIDL